jgi:hypothetical protein
LHDPTIAQENDLLAEPARFGKVMSDHGQEDHVVAGVQIPMPGALWEAADKRPRPPLYNSKNCVHREKGLDPHVT